MAQNQNPQKKDPEEEREEAAVMALTFDALEGLMEAHSREMEAQAQWLESLILLGKRGPEW